ncbi:response regulator [Paenibacillus doosanensis]|uniref:helix-turn-helix domain-containing protein n=1 Tax=Paenibacillus doosanensis TaxID=1229154 RepID=UPI00217F860F|nr:helix-turn-helix domain-containing protein [Paenibacillus doosanensis]MCS7463793.1 response regulator [Paenibacillus doosanensis]
MIRALVVDDEYFVRKGFISTMDWAAFEVTVVGEASNGRKALEWMEREPVDLLITDLAMPVMNGFDLMQEVRGRYPHVHMAVLTCHEDFKYIQEALRLGAIDYIVKTELENDQMQEALRRITMRIRDLSEAPRGGLNPLPTVRTEWSERDEERLQAQIDEWLPLYWVLKDAQFDALCDRMEEMNPPLSKLHNVMHYLLVEWNRMLHSQFLHEWLTKAEAVDSWPAWRAFISEFRGHVRHLFHVSSYPEDVVLRILEAAESAKLRDFYLTQNEMAYKLKLSRGYFSKCFKDLLGISYQDYMKELRLARAMNLLLQSSKPIADIAEECGYLDHRYFSRQFREKTGMLPSEYRSRHV